MVSFFFLLFFENFQDFSIFLECPPRILYMVSTGDLEKSHQLLIVKINRTISHLRTK
jgi:hypothetical protein